MGCISPAAARGAAGIWARRRERAAGARIPVQIVFGPLFLAIPGTAHAAAGAGALLPDTPAAALAVSTAVVVFGGLFLLSMLASSRFDGSSLFNRLFIVVSVTAGFFSAVSSAIGFGLLTSEESTDLFRNAVLPPAFGVFVFALAIAIWVGGADFVRQRDWFRRVGDGALADILFFAERTVKLFVIVPLLATILFFVSTWTTVVGIGGVDAVRHTYAFEVERLAAECAGITQYRQRDFLFLEDLKLSVRDVKRATEKERTSGAQSGAAGPGAVAAYYAGLAEWYDGLAASVAAIIEADDPSGADPYASDICAARIDELKRLLARRAYDNIDRWNREFETAFNDFALILNRWRQDRRIERLLDQQLANFDRANPKPTGRIHPAQSRAINDYAENVEDALKSLIRKQKLAKPPVPLLSAAELSPARGLDIFRDLIDPPPPAAEPETVSRTLAVVEAEVVPGLATITARDAVLKNAKIFSDIWALAISWDYAPYILMLAFLFFPSAERAKGHKD